MAEPRYLRLVKRLGTVFDTLLLLGAVGGLTGSLVAGFQGRWAEAAAGGILSFVWLLLWWLWRQAP